MPELTLPSGTVHYRESGQGTPLLLLHANPGDSRDFDAISPALAERYRTIAIDWPGYGRSATPRAAVDVGCFDRVLREFLAALALPSALFIGNSVGGNVAARLAVESPGSVLGLVLVAPGGFTPHTVFTRAFCRLQGSRFSVPPRLFARLYLKHRSATVTEMLGRAAGEHSTEPCLAVNRAVWRSFTDPHTDLREAARSISAPTLLMFGKHDPVIPAVKDGVVAARCIPRATHVVMPSGHAPFAEIPEVFMGEVLPFLARCDDGTPGTAPGDPHDLSRFVEAQSGIWDDALREIRAGRKRTHWMWFVFPQIEGLGQSPTSKRYAIRSVDEARAYLAHPVLGPRLHACFASLLDIHGRSAREIFGHPDDMKLHSCATLFAAVSEPDSVFARVLEEYFRGAEDKYTRHLLREKLPGSR